MCVSALTKPASTWNVEYKGEINSKTVTPVALAKKVREVIDSNGKTSGLTGLG